MLVPSPRRPSERSEDLRDSKQIRLYFDDGEELSESSSLAKYVRREGEKLERVSVKGSLAKNVKAWQKITDDQFLLSVIAQGYVPPFCSKVPPFFARNNDNAKKELPFVLQAVSELLLNGFAKLKKRACLVTNPMSVSVQSNGKRRLIADLRHLNK